MSLREFGEEATGERAGGSKDVVHKCWTPKVATLSLAPSVAKPTTGMISFIIRTKTRCLDENEEKHGKKKTPKE